MGADFQLIRQRTIFLLEPLTEAAHVWAEAHVSADAVRFGPAILVEHGGVADMLRHLSAAGLTVERFEP
jgi:hypothetical protein